MLHFRALECRERISDSVGMSQGVRGTRLRGVVRCSKSLPLCPRGPDFLAGAFGGDPSVAPVPAWDGRGRGGRSRGGLRLPLSPRGPDRRPGAAAGWRGLPLCPRGPDSCSPSSGAGGAVAPVPAWAGRIRPPMASINSQLPLCPRGPETWQALEIDPLEGPQVSERL